MEKLLTKRHLKWPTCVSVPLPNTSASSVPCRASSWWPWLPSAAFTLDSQAQPASGTEWPVSATAWPCRQFPEIQMKPFTRVACCLDANGIPQTWRPLTEPREDGTRHSLLPSLKGAASWNGFNGTSPTPYYMASKPHNFPRGLQEPCQGASSH